MLINLRTKFMRKVVSKLISKAIKSKAGYEVDIQFEELNANFDGGEITVKANLEAKLSKEEFMKILKCPLSFSFAKITCCVMRDR